MRALQNRGGGSKPWWLWLLIIFGCLIFVFLLLFVIWLFWLMFAVSIHARENNVPCDTPLASWLLGLACFSLCNAFVGLIFQLTKVKGLIIAHAVITLLAWITFFITGNVWVWTSKTCKDTSKGLMPNPRALMFDLYTTCWGLIIAYIVFACLFVCLFFIAIAFSTALQFAQDDTDASAYMFGSGVPRLVREVSQLRSRNRDRPNSSDYDPVPSDAQDSEPEPRATGTKQV